MPIEPWKETLDGTKTTPACVQRNPYTRQKEIVGQEDCLYLNIYTPRTSNVSVSHLFIIFIGLICLPTYVSNYLPKYGLGNVCLEPSLSKCILLVVFKFFIQTNANHSHRFTQFYISIIIREVIGPIPAISDVAKLTIEPFLE